MEKTSLYTESVNINTEKIEKVANKTFSDFNLPLPTDSSMQTLKSRTRLPGKSLSQVPEIEKNKQKILDSLLENEEYKLIFENLDYYLELGEIIDVRRIYDGIIDSGDYDYVLRNRSKFIENGIAVNIKELGEGLIKVKDWDSVISNLGILLQEIKINTLDIFNGLISRNRWFSVLNNRIFFEKKGIELDYGKIYEGLFKKGDYNTIANRLDLFLEKGVALDFGELYKKILEQDDVLTILENQLIFERRGIKISKKEIFKNCIKNNRFDVLIENRNFFMSEYKDTGDFLNDVVRRVSKENKQFFIKHYSLLRKYNIELFTIDFNVDENLKENLFLQQRYDFLNNETDYLDKDHELTNRVKRLLEDDRRLGMQLKSKLGNDDYENIWKLENLERSKIVINNEIALFYYYQFIDMEIGRIERVLDNKTRIESEHLIFIENLKESIKLNLKDVTNFLRHYLIEIIRDRLRRSGLESKSLFTLDNSNIIYDEYTNEEILDFFASSIGLFAVSDIDKSWIQIAYAGYNLFLSQTVPNILLDYIFSLQHNNGSIFNRGKDIICDEEQCMSLLNCKRDSVSLKDYVNSLESLGIKINTDYLAIARIDSIEKNYLSLD